jgi:putative acetyltransferase
MISIRESQPEDADRAIEIWRDSVDATHDFLAPDDRAAIEVEVRAFLPKTPMWLAVDEADEPQAFMILSAFKIEGLFIDPNARGSGVGRALVEHARTFIPQPMVDVNEQNQQALGFYEHMGFERIGRSALDDEGRPYPLLHLQIDPPR